MRLVLTGRHVDITPGIRRLVDSKLARLERLLGNALVSSAGRAAREKDRLEADVTVHMRGDHMLSDAHRRRDVERGAHGRGREDSAPGREGEGQVEGAQAAARAAHRPGAPDRAATASRRNGPRVVRVSRAQLKPMTVENAAIELAASGEPFLVFRNAETDGLNVLLRRPGGEFGLVEPER